MAARIDIHTFPLGEWMTNCYVVHPHMPKGLRGSPCWIIDAGFEPAKLISYVRDHGLLPEAVVMTHGHLDHIAGLELVRAAFPQVPILIHRAEADFLTQPELNLSIMMDEPVVAPAATGFLEGGQKLTLGGVNFEVRATPGHSPGGVSIYQPDDGVVFVGDALFSKFIGRTDFPTSDGALLLRSIREQLLTLPDATRVYPGHGPVTTIGAERVGNPFLR